MNNDDEFGMMLWWGGVDLDLSITTLRQKRCAVCGAPATAAVRAQRSGGAATAAAGKLSAETGTSSTA